MLIIVEGIDKAGKSTFIKKLSKKLGIPPFRKFHPDSVSKSEFHAYFKGVGFALAQLSDIFDFSAIVDRSFISDWVYSNQKTNVYEFQIWQEWEEYLGENTFIVFVEVSPSTFQDRITAEPDAYMNHEDYERNLKLYEDYLTQSRLPFIRISGEIDFSSQFAQLEAGISDLGISIPTTEN